MKLKSLLYIIPICLIAVATLTISNDSDLGYTPRDNSNDIVQSPDGFAEYFKTLNADPVTGEINPEDVMALRAAVKRLPINQSRAAADINFREMGPDNISGRVRAIESDPANPNILWAGGISGGLFRTDDAGLSWSYLPGFNENLVVSAICLLPNGTIYVGTGNSNEPAGGNGGSGFVGNGLFKSTDGGNSFSLVSDFEPVTLSTSDNWSYVNRIFRNPLNANSIWIAYGGGFREYIDGNDDLEDRADGLPSGSGTATDADISADGQIVTCVISDNVFVSRDGGQTFEDISGNGLALPTSGVGRVEFALCPNDPDNMYAFMSGNQAFLRSIWASDDGGETFDQIAFDSNGGTSAFSPCISANGQCWYDQDITVNPADCDEVIIGGVRLYKWEKAVEDPIFGQWDQIAFQFGQMPGSFVHSDIHYFHWSTDDVLYVGTDGGIFRSEDFGGSFFPVNRFLNVTQLYDMDFGPQGEVLGGSQDNGCMYIDFQGNTLQEARDVPGSGDGFDVEHSQLNGNVLFTSSQGAVVLRSNDGGINTSNFSPYMSGPFFTVQEFWETDNDPDNPNNIMFVNFTTDTIFEGETIDYASQSLSLPLSQVVSNTVFPGDTILLPDNVSTWYATSSDGANPLSISRNAANFNTTNFEWMTPISGITGRITKMRFSPDGNHLYVGTNAGRLVRISGIGNAYTPQEVSIAFRPTNTDTIINIATNDTVFGNLNSVDFSAATYMDLDGVEIPYKVHVTEIKSSTSSSITGIAVDPNDHERVALSIGGYSNTSIHVMLSESAQSTSANNTFSGIWDEPGGINGLERMPMYSVTFDMNNPNRIIAGGEFGIWVSENDGDSWEECNNVGLEGGIGRVPVMELLQQTQEEGTFNFGQIYAGTHGRGFWESGEFIVGIDDNFGDEISLIDQLNIYPNPLTDNGTISFNLIERADVEMNIYDLSGNLVSSQTRLNMSSGQRTMQFNAADFASGIYIINVRVKDQAQFGKFVKL